LAADSVDVGNLARRRASAYIVLACLLVSALVNLLVVGRLHLTTDEVENFSPLSGF